MKIRLTLLFSLMLGTVGTANLCAQGYLHASGTQIVDGNNQPYLLKGMGLGGWMLMEGYMMGTGDVANTQHEMVNKLTALMGASNTQAFYTAWRANHVTKRDVDSLKAWGFNSIRLPMHYNLFTKPIQEEPVPGQNTWLNTGFELTDSLLSWCAQNEMYLILDLHAAPGGQGQDAAISDYDNTLPSLWESQANRDKTVALWARIADHYKNEPWIGGYDLLNEVNWNLPGGTALRNLYVQITQAIRQVDQNHLIFIEGNWFANDFTGLTPTWDNNMAYSFHRYWAYNTKETIQGYLNMRQTYNVPLWMGEAGENSNVWFRDCIRLLEDNNVGWAWWPMKKTDNISGPYSITRNTGYQNIINYWKGTGTQPSSPVAFQSMLQLAENAKIQNCRYQRDVVDSWFRQVGVDTAKTFITQEIPGRVDLIDYDMGANEVAYKDVQVADYRVSSGTFTAWNNGFVDRNDGVDLEITQDPLNTRGYHVGWIESGEWLQLDVNVATTGVYGLQSRVASNLAGGSYHLQIDGADATPPIYVATTGGWQTWGNNTYAGLVLDQGRHKLRVKFDQAGYNMGSITFTQTGPSNSVNTLFLSAKTLDYHSVAVNLNKSMAGVPTPAPAFTLFVNGAQVAVSAVVADSTNARLVTLSIAQNLRATDVIKVSYTGSSYLANDGTALQTFTLEPVLNALPRLWPIPGKIEAEAYAEQNGIQLETCTDVGGGQSIGFTDVGDYWDYLVEVGQAGIYQVSYRLASSVNTGKFKLQRFDPATETYIDLHAVVTPNTGGWQTWTTVNASATLPAGPQRLRVSVTGPQVNMNWLDFTLITDIDELKESHGFKVFPNPGSGQFQLSFLEATGAQVSVSVVNMIGQSLFQTTTLATDKPFPLDLSLLSSGTYIVKIQTSDGKSATQKLVIYP